MSRLVIYGAGGFGREVLTACRGREAVLCDDRAGGTIRPHEIRDTDEVVVAIASGDIRRQIDRRLRNCGTVIAPTAVIGNGVEMGEGAIICDFAMVTAAAKIGRHFHANIYSYVAHDCVIGDFVTFAPKVCCNGSVTIGDGAYLGTGCVLKQGIAIGAGAIVGMGAVVIRDVAAGAVVIGNPAKPLERERHLAAA